MLCRKQQESSAIYELGSETLNEAVHLGGLTPFFLTSITAARFSIKTLVNDYLLNIKSTWSNDFTVMIKKKMNDHFLKDRSFVTLLFKIKNTFSHLFLFSRNNMWKKVNCAFIFMFFYFYSAIFKESLDGSVTSPS